MKNVLCIIYFFPPLGGSGVQRPLKFIKYMPQYDYCPIVETVKNGHNFAYDYSLSNQIPECAKVYRSNSGEMLWLRNIIEKVSSLKNRNKSLNNDSNSQSVTDTQENNSSLSLKDRIFKFIDLNLYIPDSKIRWYKHSIKDIKKIVHNEKIECIFSSSYPYTVHLIALYAKKMTNLPWIADFRDPWVGNVFMTSEHSEKRNAKEKKLEEEVVKFADKVIMVTDPICEIYKKRYPQYKDKFITITNGFDKDDYSEIKPVDEKKFNICYTGIMTEGQSPETLILALEKLMLSNKSFSKNFKFKIIGYVIDKYKNMLLKSSIGNNVEILSYMPHSECIRHNKSAQLNLLILADTNESKGVFSGKIFDYIGVEKPILAITPQGVASELIQSKDIGKSFEHNDVEGVYNYIKTSYEAWVNGYNITTNAISKCSEYERRVLTKKLIDLY